MVGLVLKTRSFVLTLEIQIQQRNLATGVHAVDRIPCPATGVADRLENRL
jgi:hypothetical protein